MREERERTTNGSRSYTCLNILFDLFEYKPSRPCATVTFSSGNTKSGSNAEAAPAVYTHVRIRTVFCFGIVGELCLFLLFSFFGCGVGFPSLNGMKNMIQKRINIYFIEL